MVQISFTAESNTTLRLHFLSCTALLFSLEFPILFPACWHHLPSRNPQLLPTLHPVRYSIKSPLFLLPKILVTSCCLDPQLFLKSVCCMAVILQFSLPFCSVEVGGGYLSFWLPSLWTCPAVVRKFPTLSVLVGGTTTFIPQMLKTASVHSQLPWTPGQGHYLGWRRQTRHPGFGIWSHSGKEADQWWWLREPGRSD